MSRNSVVPAHQRHMIRSEAEALQAIRRRTYARKARARRAQLIRTMVRACFWVACASVLFGLMMLDGRS